MPSIRWGLGTGADLCLPFTGNATLSGCRVIGAGGADNAQLLALSIDEGGQFVCSQDPPDVYLTLLTSTR